VTSDGSLLLVRELDERLGLRSIITENHGWPARQEHADADGQRGRREEKPTHFYSRKKGFYNGRIKVQQGL